MGPSSEENLSLWQKSKAVDECSPLSEADGESMLALIQELFPICRSITGNGVRQTLAILRRYIPLGINEVPSGTSVLDWTVPREWNIRDAYIARPDGTRIVDFAANNLHIVQYSPPVDAVMPLAELRRHLHTLPDRPEWIPYRTSYYAENWGFCLTHNQLSGLADGPYRVVIDADLAPGYLSYGEVFIPGESDERSYFPATFATLRSLTTTSRALQSRRCWRAMSRRFGRATAIAFSSSPARSDRSPGWRVTRTSLGISSMA
jgi:aminopeptidase-like protein